jgi:hypothetical protein
MKQENWRREPLPHGKSCGAAQSVRKIAGAIVSLAKQEYVTPVPRPSLPPGMFIVAKNLRSVERAGQAPSFSATARHVAHIVRIFRSAREVLGIAYNQNVWLI